MATRLAASLVVVSALSVSLAHAEGADVGKGLYDDYCAACDRASGKGDGDMAGVMTIPAPNLTMLSAGNGGVFPMLKVIHVIDGRSGVRAHGGPMPVFGRVFSENMMDHGTDYASVLETRGRVLSLAMYLESIQAK